ncbi:MAG: phosphatidylglycerophosphatase A [Gammaproteobacteria bacterium]|nr:phosphatidylglycerophosphatase A [Gammaproteobacteria bacterium]
MSSLPRPDIKHPVHFLAFGFGSGLSPKAPGTAGTLAAIPILYLMSLLTNIQYLIVLFIIIVFGIWLCEQSSKMLGVHDHPGIVWDEFAGLFVTMIAVPVSWVTILAGFILFRLFDILKPWPISWLDKKISGGLGIMLDDLVAGVFALAILQLLLKFELLPM